jgi:hypothetical protein
MTITWPAAVATAQWQPLIQDCGLETFQAAKRQKLNANKSTDFKFTEMWKSLHLTSTSWRGRAEIVVRHLRAEDRAVVVDLAAGAMGIKDLLPPDSTYIPVDIHTRGSDTILCDFNAGEFPFTVLPPPTALVAQGLYEYLLDKRLFMRMLRVHAVRVILTYSFHDLQQADPKDTIWVAPLTRKHFLEVATTSGFNVTAAECWGAVGKRRGLCDFQEIFVLDPV